MTLRGVLRVTLCGMLRVTLWECAPAVVAGAHSFVRALVCYQAVRVAALFSEGSRIHSAM